MKRNIRSTRILPCAIIALISLISLSGCIGDDLKALRTEGIDLTNVKDGQYEGKQDTSLVKVTVLVTVKDRAITDIRITRHVNGKGKKAEAIAEDVIAKQTTKIDVVSGATGSSMVILKAIENAIANAERSQ